MSWIRPCDMPADQMPQSTSPVSNTSLPRFPDTRCARSSILALPALSIETTSPLTAFLATREVLRNVRSMSAVDLSLFATICSFTF